MIRKSQEEIAENLSAGRSYSNSRSQVSCDSAELRNRWLNDASVSFAEPQAKTEISRQEGTRIHIEEAAARAALDRVFKITILEKHLTRLCEEEGNGLHGRDREQ